MQGHLNIKYSKLVDTIWLHVYLKKMQLQLHQKLFSVL